MVELRDATPQDARSIASVHIRSWQAAYRGLMPDHVLDGLSVPAREGAWRDILAAPSPRSRTIVAESGPTVIGFASTGPVRSAVESDSAAGEPYAIYLHPDVWGSGVGVELHATAVQRLRGCGFDRAGLWVPEGNGRAHRFYQREGWEFTGRSKVDRGPDGIDLPERQMHRALLVD